jgi:hypothetical protein
MIFDPIYSYSQFYEAVDLVGLYILSDFKHFKHKHLSIKILSIHTCWYILFLLLTLFIYTNSGICKILFCVLTLYAHTF